MSTQIFIIVTRGGGKNIEKLRRQLAELEAQLVLASPHLLFQVRISNFVF